jgi:nicotinate-nucleotide pyrophosphorylase (carboxylating)
MFVPRKILEDRLKQLLADDIGLGDVTAQAIIPPNLMVRSIVLAKEAGTVAGIEEAVILAESLDLKIETKVTDGSVIRNKQVLLEISGDAQTILSIERTMLNLLSRMSGIATATRTLTQKLQEEGFKTRIAATRKSAPGLLYFDKKAVMIGGGDPHRLHLDDLVIIKDNHIAIVGSVEEAVKKAKTNVSFTKKIEAEVTDSKSALKAAKAGADIIMLDNFSPVQAKATVDMLSRMGFGDVQLEISGNITDENLLEYAEADVDIISLGALTHSVRALDISLEITKE